MIMTMLYIYLTFVYLIPVLICSAELAYEINRKSEVTLFWLLFRVLFALFPIHNLFYAIFYTWEYFDRNPWTLHDPVIWKRKYKQKQ